MDDDNNAGNGEEESRQVTYVESIIVLLDTRMSSVELAESLTCLRNFCLNKMPFGNVTNLSIVAHDGTAFHVYRPLSVQIDVNLVRDFDGMQFKADGTAGGIREVKIDSVVCLSVCLSCCLFVQLVDRTSVLNHSTPRVNRR